MKTPHALFALALAGCGLPANAADAGGHAMPIDWRHVHEDSHPFGFALIDRLEYRDDDGPNHLLWDAQGWYGGDYNRLWLKTEGESPVSDSNGEFETQALYGRLVAPYWDLQAGVRYDRTFGSGPDRDRAFGVLGVQGLAPYRFETDLALFVSEDGDVSARAAGRVRAAAHPAPDPAAARRNQRRRAAGESLGRRQRSERPAAWACACATKSAASSRLTWASSG